MPSQHVALRTKLSTILQRLDRPGDVVGAGAVSLPPVQLSVDGVGDLQLPISTAQAEALWAVSVDAPYGRGARTVVDRDVRCCRQIDAGALRVDDPSWQDTLARIVTASTTALGVDVPVSAELYKMLVYSPGDFFLEHRDNEKAAGMFATLVVALPSAHEGGDLVVRHKGREVTIPLAGADPRVARWAAFYCDCTHALRPVRGGYRVVLVYNLTRSAKRRARAPDAGPAVDEIAAALSPWTRRRRAPAKLVVPLEHRYTNAELDFGALKGHDAAVAHALTHAVVTADCTLRLAMLAIEERGTAYETYEDDEGEDEPGSTRYLEENEDGDVQSYRSGEVESRECTAFGWRAVDASREDYGVLRVDEALELVPPGALRGARPDEDELCEAMGNEAASFERRYRRAALVVWPNAREREVFAQGGVDAPLAGIERYLRSDRERASALARHTVAAWPSLHRGRYAELARQNARALRLCLSIDDRESIADLVLAIATATGLVGADAAISCVSGDWQARPSTEEVAAIAQEELDAMVAALTVLPVEQARGAMLALVRACSTSTLRAVASVCCEVANARTDDAVRAPIEALLDALPSVPVSGHLGPSDAYLERTAALVEILCAAQAVGGDALAYRAAQAIVDEPSAAPMRRVLTPVVVELLARPRRPSATAMAPVLSACARFLDARLALPLTPPVDASRETGGLACDCPNCEVLRDFLRDPVATSWQFRAARPSREHIAQEVWRSRVDLDLRTREERRPFVLEGTKSNARHELRAKQRAADVTALAALRAWSSG